MAERKDKSADDAMATFDSGAEAAEHQPGVETPKEIGTTRAAVKAGPDERRAAMAAENASTFGSVDTTAKDRDERAQQMAQENATAAMPLDDDDARRERAERAQMMAGENATGAAH